MKALTTVLLSAVVTGAAQAGDIYNGFARGNSDVYPEGIEQVRTKGGDMKTALQPGVGDAAMRQRSAWSLQPPSQDERFVPTIETFGQ
jgi:hypothetical protein